MSAPLDDLTARLLDRSGAIKRSMVEFSQRREFRDLVAQAAVERNDIRLFPPDKDRINTIDYFMLQFRFDDGSSFVERFLAAHSELLAEERAMVRGWSTTVEGVFEVTAVDDQSLHLHNLLDELDYRTFSNAGPTLFAGTRVGSFVIGRIAPIREIWMLSGVNGFYGRSERNRILRIAATLAQAAPRLLFTNPAKLEQALALQAEEHRVFVAFFGSDLVIVPGNEVQSRLNDAMKYRVEQHRDADGTTQVERAQADGIKTGPLPTMEIPDSLAAAATVGLLSDPVEGLSILPDFGVVAEAFANPERAGGRESRETVLNYLKNPGFDPLPLRYLARRDPEKASQLLRRLLNRPKFDWSRDGESLLKQSKPRAFLNPPLPRIAPLGAPLVEAMRMGAASRHVGRNDPCPCGSGKKFKRCHGATV
jgi:hypothetical protein